MSSLGLAKDTEQPSCPGAERWKVPALPHLWGEWPLGTPARPPRGQSITSALHLFSYVVSQALQSCFIPSGGTGRGFSSSISSSPHAASRSVSQPALWVVLRKLRFIGHSENAAKAKSLLHQTPQRAATGGFCRFQVSGCEPRCGEARWRQREIPRCIFLPLHKLSEESM